MANKYKVIDEKTWNRTMQHHFLFVDGVHIGQFVEKLQSFLNNDLSYSGKL